jgi:hypothetical protein
VRFWHGQQNGMILRLGTAVDNNNAPAGVDGCFCKDLEE